MQLYTFTILMLISCENKKETESLYPATQTEFQDSTRAFTTLQEGANNDKEQAAITNRQEEWIKRYCDKHAEVKGWIGTYDISDADTAEMIVTIEDFGVCHFQCLLTPDDTALRKIVALITYRSLVRFSASHVRLMEFEYDEKKEGHATLTPIF